MRRSEHLPLLAAVAGVLLGVLSVVLVGLDGGSVRPWLVVLLCVAGCVVAAEVSRLVVDWLGEARAEDARTSVAATHAATDRERGGTARVERLVAKAMTDPDRFADTLAPWLRTLAEHRLRSRYGVDSRTDPERARILVGDELWYLLTTHRPVLPTPAILDRCVARLEAL